MTGLNKKILFIDIEWAPATAYTFDMWNANFSPEKIIDAGGLLCFAAHWSGQKEYLFYSEWEHGREHMAGVALAMLSEADAVVTYNGDKYDLPKLRGEIVLAGLTPPPPVTSIDLIKPIKKFGFIMNRLAYIAPLLGIGSKKKHEGFELWVSVLKGDPQAQKRMERYCVQDVRLLVRLYKRIASFIDNHPFIGDERGDCGNCGSHRMQHRGYRRTKFYKIQRLHCQSCGSWQTGTKQKVG
jgi:hypothetical protein